MRFQQQLLLRRHVGGAHCRRLLRGCRRCLLPERWAPPRRLRLCLWRELLVVVGPPKVVTARVGVGVPSV